MGKMLLTFTVRVAFPEPRPAGEESINHRVRLITPLAMSADVRYKTPSMSRDTTWGLHSKA